MASLLLLIAFVALAAKLNWEHRILLGPSQIPRDRYDRRSHQLAANKLSNLSQLRRRTGWVACGTIGLSMIGIFVLPTIAVAPLMLLSVIAMTTGECCERLLYFSSVVYDRMPGTLR